MDIIFNYIDKIDKEEFGEYIELAKNINDMCDEKGKDLLYNILKQKRYDLLDILFENNFNINKRKYSQNSYSIEPIFYDSSHESHITLKKLIKLGLQLDNELLKKSIEYNNSAKFYIMFSQMDKSEIDLDDIFIESIKHYSYNVTQLIIDNGYEINLLSLNRLFMNFPEKITSAILKKLFFNGIDINDIFFFELDNITTYDIFINQEKVNKNVLLTAISLGLTINDIERFKKFKTTITNVYQFHPIFLNLKIIDKIGENEFLKNQHIFLNSYHDMVETYRDMKKYVKNMLNVKLKENSQHNLKKLEHIMNNINKNIKIIIKNYNSLTDLYLPLN